MTNRYRTEFPDYDPASLPAIPADWIDTSWHNDACPSFVVDRLHIFVDYADPADSEFPGERAAGTMCRFSVQRVASDHTADPDPTELLATDDWTELLAFVASHD